MKAELVAILWPIVDSTTGLIQRVLARGYFVLGGDEVISATLKCLTTQDYLLATPYRIPDRFVIETDLGRIEGCVSVEIYQQCESGIIGPILQELEKQHAIIKGVNRSSLKDLNKEQNPRFPESPYIITTFLIESPDGLLSKQR